MSYVELNKYVDELASGFIDLQLKHGDTIALWLPNNLEHVLAQFAAAKVGLTVASIDRSIATADELAYVLKDSKAAALMYENKIERRDHASVALKVYEQQDRKSPLHTLITTSIDPTDGVLQFQHILVNALERHVVAGRRSQVDASTAAVIPYSSNNGQQPTRGTLLTHGDILKKAQELASSLKLTSNDKVAMSEVPAGFLVASVAAALKNAQVIVASVDRMEHALKVEKANVIGNTDGHFTRA
ncbi:hypothetical protein SPRG_14868 [Saprolegnia parasitica CBS 223.65]|uniref:AMP-dependent synthetase/ligase domain-containing protein n=1 Tax=Saprolegnia parasitica (strain CBS 223.65) TaxID=695850 RepID=A0A067BMB9_SAPPC|nr:hypothetical protein SPRG_14868 [Saprolegnia parasitica CBS 223.65]KDO19348.1 hypothetical protein SPRG_14868 [Saprolegnia parasitica CBS 223.65]|eukprot:XP_012209936.1 hypothetical protein SPRG_14868 [Saprolegnia parasitica CBS 223.65]